MCEQINGEVISGHGHQLLRDAGYEYLGKVNGAGLYRMNGELLVFDMVRIRVFHPRLQEPRPIKELREVLKELHP